MIYQYSSIKEVIGNVIRNTGVTDTAYITSMPEWIGEAMAFMRTKMELVSRYKDVCIDFHTGQIPVGCASVDAIEYQGRNLPYNKHIHRHHHHLVPNPITQPYSAYEADELIFLTEAPQQCFRLHPHHHTYYTEMGYIKTSFSDGKVRVHFQSMPVDDDEFPLVPDNANYKQALYWHCRAMMIGCGYEDRVFKYDYCDAQYEKYAARAIAGIRYPSTDMVEERLPTIARFLPDNYLGFFGMGHHNHYDGSGTEGFAAVMPVSKTDMYVEQIISIVNPANFIYHPTGQEGVTLQLNELKGKTILELFLDSYLLQEEKSISTPLTPNTFRFVSLTGTLTFYNTLTVDNVVQGLRTT